MVEPSGHLGPVTGLIFFIVYRKTARKFTIIEEYFVCFFNFNCNLNVKYIISFTIRNMRSGLYSDLTHFPFTLQHTSLNL
jgi:hypothetical protein